VLVQEDIHSSASSKSKGMVVKLDMANAFDRVCHGFLLKVMDKFGLNSSFIKWLATCFGKPWIVPLVNGIPSHLFQVSRGLRQHCPLSPLLFLLVDEILSRKLKHLENIPS
jgi:hypothetical protein